jgi:hypothetical protein
MTVGFMGKKDHQVFHASEALLLRILHQEEGYQRATGHRVGVRWKGDGSACVRVCAECGMRDGVGVQSAL